MGIIKAIAGALGGGLADQWLEIVEPDDMAGETVFTSGVSVSRDSKRSSNKKGTENYVSDGSIIHVYDNQFMFIVDGGKIVDYTSEPGYFEVDNKAAPSMFSGGLGASIKETFRRIKYGGVPSVNQKVFYVNLQEIKGIKFGTKNAVNYFDQFYNSELFLRAFGTYSIKVTDPLKFYQEAVPRNADRLQIDEINEQYMSEFLDALQSAVNQMSADGIRISHVTSKSRELSKYMAETLDEDWRQLRGMEIIAVGLASISYDDESQKLINMRNQGAMLSDPTIREGYVQGSMARGFEAAGSNEGGAGAGFLGIGMGNMASEGMAGAFTQSNRQQMQQPAGNADAQAGGWTCECSKINPSDAKFCNACGKKRPESQVGWTCGCGHGNAADAKFCSECGNPRPENNAICPKCGYKSEGSAKFCPECGSPI